MRIYAWLSLMPIVTPSAHWAPDWRPWPDCFVLSRVIVVGSKTRPDTIRSGVKMPQLDRVLESVLYTADMQRARAFFENVLELQPLTTGDRMTAYALGPSMLLLFQHGATDETVHLPKHMGTIPPHDGQGRQHLALAIGTDELDVWTQHLAQHQVAV